MNIHEGKGKLTSMSKLVYSFFAEDDMPKTLFCFEFEDKDGKVYKQYVKEVGNI